MTNAMALEARHYVDGVLNGQRAMLARAITLVESRAEAHRQKAEEVLQAVMPKTGRSRRIGITGVPGVGKSTFIESLGCRLCDQGQRVAVLTVDPTSALTGGSILGDKTRMEQLSRHANAFIRPSAAGDTLGGVARKTREAMYLCEAAGFDTVLVETVGVGQSEMAVRSMVDFFLLMVLPGGGDELQGIKKGIVEMADALFINKADGANQEAAAATQRDYAAAVRSLKPATRGWHTEVFAGSARTGAGMADIWGLIEKFFDTMSGPGFVAQRRREQVRAWLRDTLKEELQTRFFRNGAIMKEIERVDEAVMKNELSVTQGVRRLLDAWEKSKGNQP